MSVGDSLRRLVADMAGIELHGEMADEPQMRELGASGVTKYGTLNLPEYLPELRGQQSYRVFDKMRRSDAQVRATLRLVKTPIIGAQWYVQPCHDTPDCRMQAAFMQWNLFHGMRHSFIRFLSESLLMLDFGFYAFEKVFKWEDWTPPKETDSSRPRARRVVAIDKFAPRHPLTIEEFKFNTSGDYVGVVHRRVDGNNNTTTRVDIPSTKLLMLTLDEEAEDPAGTSVLRSAYKHWYYKEQFYKIDAIQKERHGIGIPIVRLPPGFTDDDKREANKLGKNLRTNEEAHVTLPPGWELEFASTNTNLVDILKSAEHHDLMIARNVLGQFLNLGSTTTGSRAVGSEHIEIFMKALRYVADIIRSEVNLYVIPELITWNFERYDGFPELRVRRIGEEADWRAFSVAVRNLIESGAVTPDGDLEAWIRETTDMPIASQEALDRSPDDRLGAAETQLRTPGAAGQRQEEI